MESVDRDDEMDIEQLQDIAVEWSAQSWWLEDNPRTSPAMTGGVQHPEGSSGKRALLLTPEEAATALGIGRTMVYQLIRSRALGSVQIGRCRRIPMSALHRFVDDRLEGSTNS
jgi:excisionase family DNA binding protein